MAIGNAGNLYAPKIRKLAQPVGAPLPTQQPVGLPEPQVGHAMAEGKASPVARALARRAFRQR